MNKNELYDKINDRRRRQLLPPMTREEFVASISSLEAKGLIRTEANECFSENYTGVIVVEDRTQVN